MASIPYVSTGTYLFRFMNPNTPHFWTAITEMLSEHKLFLNSRTKFNDPYDSQPIIDADLSNSEIRKYVQDAISNPANPNRSTKSIAAILSFKASGKTLLPRGRIELIKTGLTKSANEFLDTGGLLSFSLSAENPLLWGHYAASFTGVSAIFKRGESMRSALSVCAKVTYVTARPHLPLSVFQRIVNRRMAGEPYDDEANQVFFLSFLHKSAHWAYEQEARIFYPFHAFERLPFEASELVGFILGPNASVELEKKMRETIRLHRPSTALYRASLSRNEFRITIPHIFTRHHARAA